MSKWWGYVAFGGVLAVIVVAVVVAPARSSSKDMTMVRIKQKPSFFLKPRPTAAPYDHLADRKGRYVVVDLSDFRLYEMEDGWVKGQLPISAGDGSHFREYDDKGRLHEGDKITPVGLRYADHGTAGRYKAPLGIMDWPVWLLNAPPPDGDNPEGVAIHGENIADHQNLSHGCIRIDWSAAPDFYHWIPQGAVVIVQQ